MNIKSLSDHDLLAETKRLTENEPAITTQILHHLREVEHRRLILTAAVQACLTMRLTN